MDWLRGEENYWQGRRGWGGGAWQVWKSGGEMKHVSGMRRTRRECQSAREDDAKEVEEEEKDDDDGKKKMARRSRAGLAEQLQERVRRAPPAS